MWLSTCLTPAYQRWVCIYLSVLWPCMLINCFAAFSRHLYLCFLLCSHRVYLQCIKGASAFIWVCCPTLCAYCSTFPPDVYVTFIMYIVYSCGYLPFANRWVVLNLSSRASDTTDFPLCLPCLISVIPHTINIILCALWCTIVYRISCECTHHSNLIVLIDLCTIAVSVECGCLQYIVVILYHLDDQQSWYA